MKNKDSNDNSFHKIEKIEEPKKEIGLNKSNNLSKSQNELDNKDNILDLNDDSYNSDEKKVFHLMVMPWVKKLVQKQILKKI